MLVCCVRWCESAVGVEEFTGEFRGTHHHQFTSRCKDMEYKVVAVTSESAVHPVDNIKNKEGVCMLSSMLRRCAHLCVL